MAIIRRKIDLTIRLGQGSFGEGGYDTVKLQGLRVSAAIKKGGLPSFDSAIIRVWGLPPSLANRVSTLGRQAFFNRVNQVIVEAGDDAAGTVIAYAGMINEAYQDSSGPDMALNIVSQTSTVSATRPLDPVTYTAPVNAAVAAANIAQTLTPSVSFENHGVNVMLPPSYLSGTAVEQLRKLQQAAGFNATIDGDVLAIWPKGGARDGLVPDINKDTGLVGYPRFSGSGNISLTTLFQPGIRLGGKFNLTTALGPASGVYQSNGLDFDLEAEMPDGKWFANIAAYRPGNGI